MTINKAEIAFMLGFSATGDFGWSTWYTRANGQKVVFAKYVLDGKRKTPARVAQRDRWRAAAAEWRALPITTKQNWLNACRNLSLPLTGYNLFMFWVMQQDRKAIETIERQSGLSLL